MSVKVFGNNKCRTSQAGFGMVEVVVSLGIIGLILTAVASGLSFSLNNTAEAKFRGIALSKSQEVMEVIRRERTIRGWDSFVQQFSGGAPGIYTYCLNTTTSIEHGNFPPTVGACSDTASWDGNAFIRELSVDTTVANQVSFTAVVYWQGRDKQIQLNQSLQKW